MSLLKVAMLTQVYLPFIGGAEKQLAAILQRMPALGVEPLVITRRHDDSPLEDVVEGTRVQRIAVGRQRELASLAYTVKGLRALWRFRPDVIHAFELRSPSATAISYKALTGTPVLAKVLRGGTLGDIAAMQRKATSRFRLNRMLRGIDAYAVISREIDAELAAVGVPEHRRHFIPNGVDLAQYALPDAAEKAALRQELGLTEGPVALFAGRLEPEKRVDRLVAIWPQVRAAVPGATLIIVGTGGLEAQLRANAGPGVRLVGKQISMRPWFAAANSFVLPSVAEGLSNAMLEALAMDLPVVATAVGAAPDLLAGGLGELVAVGDDAALAAALIRVLSGAGSAAPQSAGQRRALVQRDYSLDATAEKLAALYHRLAGRA